VNGVADTLERDPDNCNICHDGGTASCNICHGGVDNQTGAPPEGLEGELLTSQLAVGAHTGHVDAGPIADAFYCTECHITPVNMLDPGHLGADSVAELTWGGIAGSMSVWDRGTGSCSQTYCHGNFLGGYGSNAPVWTASNQADCGSCHDVGSDPITLEGKHRKHVEIKDLECNRCHSTTVDTFLNIIGPNLHVDGQNQVSFSTGQGTYLDETCSGLETECHDTRGWYTPLRHRP
jgi:predicted CxxxxCH...CXXCH cytochrome family protein